MELAVFTKTYLKWKTVWLALGGAFGHIKALEFLPFPRQRKARTEGLYSNQLVHTFYRPRVPQVLLGENPTSPEDHKIIDKKDALYIGCRYSLQFIIIMKEYTLYHKFVQGICKCYRARTGICPVLAWLGRWVPLLGTGRAIASCVAVIWLVRCCHMTVYVGQKERWPWKTTEFHWCLKRTWHIL